MANLIYLNKYDKNFNVVSISEKEWKICAQKLGLNLKRDKSGRLCEAEYYDEEKEEYLPICWIDEDGGSIPQRAFGPENIERLMEIAAHFEAIVSAIEGEIVYEPNYGLTFDDSDPFPSILITLDDLRENEVYSSPNIKQAIEDLILKKNKKYPNDAMSIEVREKRVTEFFVKPRKRWWEFWK